MYARSIVEVILFAAALLTTLPRDLPVAAVLTANDGRITLDVSSPSPESGWTIDPSKVKFELKTSNPLARTSISLGKPERVPLTGTVMYRFPLNLPPDPSQGSWYWTRATVRPAIASKVAAKLKIYPAETTTFRFYSPRHGAADDLTTVRSRWIGKNVWVNGAAGLLKDTTILWDLRKPVKIVGISRVKLPLCYTGGMPEWNGVMGWGPGCFWQQDSLRIDFAVPPGWWEPLDNGGSYFTEPGTPHKESTTASIYAADEWQFATLFSTVPPDSLLAAASPKVRKAFLHREVVNGMSRGLVIRFLGYPEPGEKPVLMNRQRTWIWMGPAPFSFVGRFDEMGNLRDFRSEGRLP